MTELERKSLLQCGLFDGIEDWERLMDCLGAQWGSFARNELLWQMGDRVSACAVVLSGSVRAESVNAAGERLVTAIHTPGGLVGDVLMATPGSVSPVYVIAQEPTRVLYLPYRHIMGGCSKCCPDHTRLRENLLTQLARKFWLQRRRIGYLSAKSLRSRLAMYLLDRCGEAGSGRFQLGMTQEALADFLCANRSALTRELGRMREEGLIDFRRGEFSLPDPEALSRYRFPG